jgi:transcription termination factor Rho
MSEPVLERSVLERKERDELQTIAKALGAKATSRAKKADLVDLILTTAGVSAPAAAPAPAAEPSVPAQAETNGGQRPDRAEPARAR